MFSVVASFSLVPLNNMKLSVINRPDSSTYDHRDSGFCSCLQVNLSESSATHKRSICFFGTRFINEKRNNNFSDP